MNDYARYSSLAFQMIAIIIGGVVGGIYLDKWIPTGFPLFTIGLIVLSVILAIYFAIKDFL